MPRPFYIIGHNPNCVPDAIKALRSGGNALEPDIHLDREAGRFRVCHDDPTVSDPILEDYLEGVHAELASNHEHHLDLITFDLKPEYDYDLNQLYTVIRERFSDRHPNILIATTISDPDKIGFLKAVEGNQRPNEFVGIDENAQPEEVQELFAGCSLQYIFAAGIDVFDFAPLNALIGPRSFLDRIGRAASLRDASEASASRLKLVYPWTVNNEDDIRAYLDLDPPIDGLLTDHPDRVRAILEENYAHKFQLEPDAR